MIMICTCCELKHSSSPTSTDRNRILKKIRDHNQAWVVVKIMYFGEAYGVRLTVCASTYGPSEIQSVTIIVQNNANSRGRGGMWRWESLKPGDYSSEANPRTRAGDNFARATSLLEEDHLPVVDQGLIFEFIHKSALGHSYLCIGNHFCCRVEFIVQMKRTKHM